MENIRTAAAANAPSPAVGTMTTTRAEPRAEPRAGHLDTTADRMTAAEFDEAFTAVMPRLRRRLLALTGDPHDADDLVQETYLRLSGRARASALTRQHQPYAYTCAAALNLLRDSWRQPARRERCTDRLPEPSWDGGFATREAEAVTTALLRVLSPKEAAAVILVDIEGLTHDMAGERLGAHRGTVQRNRMRGLAKMRAALGAYEPGSRSVTPTKPDATARRTATTPQVATTTPQAMTTP
ncbi:RNA polymerase sigma factor [Streptomyces lavendofoliae]|uniref:RNA polymerase sigma factor n=1 Tax=Streptomyces lavendofoliae TaxID=67314 RepID=A0A918M5V0_9ACTN|nr:RNA polymerase sigma factor [Streptomyces lavendofoliae]GGU48085.1 hypothetical protein GCM10010274_40900 [Streptomyces lavendofoliae]